MSMSDPTQETTLLFEVKRGLAEAKRRLPSLAFTVLMSWAMPLTIFAAIWAWIPSYLGLETPELRLTLTITLVAAVPVLSLIHAWYYSLTRRLMPWLLVSFPLPWKVFLWMSIGGFVIAIAMTHYNTPVASLQQLYRHLNEWLLAVGPAIAVLAIFIWSCNIIADPSRSQG